MEKKLSLSFRILRGIGLNFPEEEYGQVSLWLVMKRILVTYKNAFLLKYFMNIALLSPINPRKFRPMVLKWIGCKVGRDVFIGSGIGIDSGNASLITIEDHVHIAARAYLLCHKRDLSKYCVGYDYAKLPYQKHNIILKKGCAIGTGTIVMPGVTVGEGAIVGAGSLVTHDIPAWTIAVGSPAKIIRKINNGF